MAADKGRKGTVLARQACFFCRTRKKKCDKSLPSCTYCAKYDARKQLNCIYEDSSPRRKLATQRRDGRVLVPAGNRWSDSGLILATALRGNYVDAAFEDQVYSVAYKTIRATGQFVDDITARYFQTYQQHLPIISRTRFYNNLITLGSIPAADFSTLLLCLCLFTYKPTIGRHSVEDDNPAIELQSLYLTAKSLFAQVQACCPPTLCLVQAGILIALYEYTRGESDSAFVTIASVVRIAYASRIHLSHSDQARAHCLFNHRLTANHLQESEEAANTWWGIVICERIFFCELSVFDQPFATLCPKGDARLPSDASILDGLDETKSKPLPNIAVASLNSPYIGGFGRTAQAVCLLDQVLKALDCGDVNSKLIQLDRLNSMLQEFLRLVMPQCSKSSGVFCSAVNIPMRTLILLHRHILDQHPQAATANFGSIHDWSRQSQEALGTVAKMVVDIAESLVDGPATGRASALIDGMPPTYPHLSRATLSLIHSGTLLEDTEWQEAAEDALQMSLERYSSRWYLDSDKACRKEDEDTQNSPA